MSRIRYVLLLILLLTPLGCAREMAPQTDASVTAPVAVAETDNLAGPKVNLRIFYAGHLGSAREKDFARFLGRHFASVATGDLATFEPGQAKDADVVLFDYDGDGFKAPRPQVTLANYHRATMTVGVAGGLFCEMMRLKIGYL